MVNPATAPLYLYSYITTYEKEKKNIKNIERRKLYKSQGLGLISTMLLLMKNKKRKWKKRNCMDPRVLTNLNYISMLIHGLKEKIKGREDGSGGEEKGEDKTM